MKNQSVIIIVGVLILFFLFFTKQGRQTVTRVIDQGAPVNINFGGSEYQPGVYVLPDFQIPLVNGVSLPPPLSSLQSKGECCCSSTPSGRSAPPPMPFVSPSVVPSYTPPPQSVSLSTPAYSPPQEPDYAAYLRKYPDLTEFVQGTHLQQPHWTRGQGLKEADYNRDGRVQDLEFARWFWETSGELRGDTMPTKDRF